MILSLYFNHFRDICIFSCIVLKICKLPYTVNTVNTVNVTRQGYVMALTTNKGCTLITGDQTTDGGDHNTPRTIPQT